MTELTERQRQVLEARMAGEGLKQVAARLGIHWGTVARYQHRAVRALGCRTLVSAGRVWAKMQREEAVRSQT